MRTRDKVGACVLAALMTAGLVAVFRKQSDGTSPHGSASATPSPSSITSTSASGSSDAGVDDTALRRLAATLEGGVGDLKLSAKWGSGQGQLGRERPQEGNPEGPMSFALSGGKMVVLDQVNGRLLKYDDKGKLERAIDTKATIQDVTVTKDGTMLALDRLADKTISVYDPNGRKTGELSLSGEKVGESGLLTGVFTDGKDVYVEKEHGVLVHVGTTDGQPGDDTKELAGRPSKDGKLLLTAVIADVRAGRVVLNAVDRASGSSKFARQIQFPRPAQTIVLLDTDAKGIVYLGAACGPGGTVAEITCHDPGDGHVLGRVDVPLSATPEESFRDFAVSDDGSIVYALRSEDGAEYRSVHCP